MVLRWFGSLAVSALLIGCSNRSDVREWQPADHNGQQSEATQSQTAAEPPDEDPIIAAIALYRVHCAGCHGVAGRGDGPQGKMLHTPDFTQAVFQSQRVDAQIMAVIAGGRGAMPSFGDSLSELSIESLVGLVRRFGMVSSSVPSHP